MVPRAGSLVQSGATHMPILAWDQFPAGIAPFVYPLSCPTVWKDNTEKCGWSSWTNTMQNQRQIRGGVWELGFLIKVGTANGKKSVVSGIKAR